MAEMKRYKVSKLVVVQLNYYTNAKNEANAAKALHKHQQDLEEMEIEYILPLDELGTWAKDITPRSAPKKNRIKPLAKLRARG